MQVLQKQQVANQSGAASWDSGWIPVAAAGFRNVSMSTSWIAGASTAGTLSWEGTDDPAHGAPVPLTANTYHGTGLTVGTGAGQTLIAFSGCPGYVRQKYTRSAGGVANQFNLFVTLTD